MNNEDKQNTFFKWKMKKRNEHFYQKSYYFRFVSVKRNVKGKGVNLFVELLLLHENMSQSKA